MTLSRSSRFVTMATNSKDGHAPKYWSTTLGTREREEARDVKRCHKEKGAAPLPPFATTNVQVPPTSSLSRNRWNPSLAFWRHDQQRVNVHVTTTTTSIDITTAVVTGSSPASVSYARIQLHYPPCPMRQYHDDMGRRRRCAFRSSPCTRRTRYT